VDSEHTGPDETARRIVSQAAAGHLDWHWQIRMIAAAIRDAVATEREACAALAETHQTPTANGYSLTPTPGEIARAIRARATATATDH
jgi:hypothetical protein